MIFQLINIFFSLTNSNKSCKYQIAFLCQKLWILRFLNRRIYLLNNITVFVKSNELKLIHYILLLILIENRILFENFQKIVFEFFLIFDKFFIEFVSDFLVFLIFLNNFLIFGFCCLSKFNNIHWSSGFPSKNYSKLGNSEVSLCISANSLVKRVNRGVLSFLLFFIDNS